MTCMHHRALSTIASTLLMGAALAATSPPAATERGTAGKSGAQTSAALLSLRQHQYMQASQQLAAAANAGDAEAQYLLGMIQLNGLGQVPDVRQAAAWLEKAGAQGHGPAAFVLAALYSRGELADAARARRWLQRAADLGYERARAALADPRPLLAAVRELPQDAALLPAFVRYAAVSDDAALLAQLGKPALAVRDEFGCAPLCQAVALRARSLAGWLLQQGADPQSADAFGVTPLMIAATQESPDLLTLLLSSPRVLVNAVDQEQRSALFYAARADRADAVRSLRQAGASLAQADSRGYGALDFAVLADARRAADALRGLGAKQLAAVSARGDTVTGIDLARPGVLYRDWQAPAVAAARDDAAQLRSLLASTPGALRQATPQGDTLLHVAYHAGAMNALRALLDAGADPGAADRRGRSVLALAARDNNQLVMQLLLTAGRAPREAQGAALIAAVSANGIDSARLLLGAGASANASNAAGTGVLALAAHLGRAELLQLLVGSGANPNATDRSGRTALWHAARAGQVESVDLLLAAHAAVDTADQEGNTPLMAGILSGKPAIITRLVAAGAQTGVVNRSGDTALLLAAAGGQLELVQALLARSHRIDAQNRHGDTAIIAASRNGHAAVCRALLKDGASLKLRNGNRLTAADAARDRGFAALANELDKAG